MPSKKRSRETWMKLRSKEILKAFMQDKGFSTTRLGRYAGCHRSMIGHLVSGHYTTCSEDLGKRIAEALGVPPIALFDPQASAVSGRPSHRQRTETAA